MGSSSGIDLGNVNRNTKSQLLHIVNLIDLSLSPFDPKLKNQLEILIKATNGGIIFDVDTQIEIAIRSFHEPDTSLGEQYHCDIIVIQQIRRRLLAVLLFIYPEVSHDLIIDDSISAILTKLTSLSEQRFPDRAMKLIKMPSLQYPVRNFFSSFSEHLTLYPLFAECGIELSKEDIFVYDRSVRNFLNTDEIKWRSFPLVLRRYLFARLASRMDNTLFVEESLDKVSEIRLHYSHPQYFGLNRVKKFAQKESMKNDLQVLVMHITNGNNPGQLGADFSAVARFIFNLYLVDSGHVFSEEELYLQAIANDTNAMLKHMRNSISWIDNLIDFESDEEC